MPSSPKKKKGVRNPRPSRRTTDNILLNAAATDLLEELYALPEICTILKETPKERLKNNTVRFVKGTFPKIALIMSNAFTKAAGLSRRPEETEALKQARLLTTPTEKDNPAYRPLFPRVEGEKPEAYVKRVERLPDVRYVLYLQCRLELTSALRLF